jgi:hypothetical protein
MIGRTFEWRLKRRDESIVNAGKSKFAGNAPLGKETATPREFHHARYETETVPVRTMITTQTRTSSAA